VFRKHKAAWAFFERQPSGYRKRVVWRILSAKQQATRDKRLAALIAASAKGERMPERAVSRARPRSRRPRW